MPSDIHAALGNVFHLQVTHHLSLSSCHIEDWAFSLFESFLLATIYLKHFYTFATIQPKIPKTLAFFIVLFIILANQYLQLLVGSTTFSNRKVLQLISCTWESSTLPRGNQARRSGRATSTLRPHPLALNLSQRKNFSPRGLRRGPPHQHPRTPKTWKKQSPARIRQPARCSIWSIS